MSESKFVNIKDLKKIVPKMHINKQGRMLGDLVEFDCHYKVEVKVKEKLLKLTKIDQKTSDTIKSSTESTRVPFINVMTMCKYIFGEEPEGWERELTYLRKEDDGIVFEFK